MGDLEDLKKDGARIFTPGQDFHYINKSHIAAEEANHPVPDPNDVSSYYHYVGHDSESYR